MYDNARHQLVREIAAALSVPPAVAENNIDYALTPPPGSGRTAPKDAPIDLKAQIEGIELERIQTALGRADGVISEAARLLTLKRTTLIEKMRKYGVDRVVLQ
jgi:sigma-54 specific flagellar transcriptional regulator A